MNKTDKTEQSNVSVSSKSVFWQAQPSCNPSVTCQVQGISHCFYSYMVTLDEDISILLTLPYGKVGKENNMAFRYGQPTSRDNLAYQSLI